MIKMPIPDYSAVLQKTFRGDNPIGKCNVYTIQNSTDLNGGEESEEEVLLYENLPCHLSINSAPIASDGLAANVTKETKLFVDPDVNIPPGSKIVVTQRGITETYTNSGQPFAYQSHRGISLTLYDQKA